VSPRTRRTPALRIAVRTSGTVAVVLFLYYALPLTVRPDAITGLLLAAGLMTVIVLVVWQTRAIVVSEHPRLRAAESLALAVPLFLVLFSAAYYLISQNDPSEFSEALSRTDALYFSVTVFSTVGFGDITARSAEARLLVTGQMVGDLLFIGLGLRALLTAMQIGVRRRSSEAAPAPDAVDVPGIPGMPGGPVMPGAELPSTDER
jgi:Ion channel